MAKCVLALSTTEPAARMLTKAGVEGIIEAVAEVLQVDGSIDPLANLALSSLSRRRRSALLRLRRSL